MKHKDVKKKLKKAIRAFKKTMVVNKDREDKLQKQLDGNK